MARFIVAVSHRGRSAWTSPPSRRRIRRCSGCPPWTTGPGPTRCSVQNIISCTHYEPDFDALRAASTRIVLAAGVEVGRPAGAPRGAIAVAERLGTEPVQLPERPRRLPRRRVRPDRRAGRVRREAARGPHRRPEDRARYAARHDRHPASHPRDRQEATGRGRRHGLARPRPLGDVRGRRDREAAVVRAAVRRRGQPGRHGERVRAGTLPWRSSSAFPGRAPRISGASPTCRPRSNARSCQRPTWSGGSTSCAPVGPRSTTSRQRVAGELRPGSRGGGRSRDQIVRHVYGTEPDQFSRKVEVRTPVEAVFTAGGLATHREAYLDADPRLQRRGQVGTDLADPVPRAPDRPSRHGSRLGDRGPERPRSSVSDRARTAASPRDSRRPRARHTRRPRARRCCRSSSRAGDRARSR